MTKTIELSTLDLTILAQLVEMERTSHHASGVTESVGITVLQDLADRLISVLNSGGDISLRIDEPEPQLKGETK